MLGAFAAAITHSGLPQQLAGVIIRKLNGGEGNAKGEGAVKWLLLAIILCMGVMSQNVVPIHIAFIPMIIPPLLLVFNRLKLDRRLVACVTFGLVTTYMFLPYGFGAIFLNDIMLGNIRSAGMDTSGINVMHAMAIPALGMVSGLLLAFCTIASRAFIKTTPPIRKTTVKRCSSKSRQPIAAWWRPWQLPCALPSSLCMKTHWY